MNKIESNIEDISQNYYKYLMSLKNVTGVGLGYKKINNIDTKEPCIHVLVEKKVDDKYISLNNLIPKNYLGIKTDVIQSGTFKLLSTNLDEYDDIKIPYKVRPIHGGC